MTTLPSDILAAMLAQAILSAPLSRSSLEFYTTIGGRRVGISTSYSGPFWTTYLWSYNIQVDGESVDLSRKSRRLLSRAMTKRYRLCEKWWAAQQLYQQETLALSAVEGRLLGESV